MKRNIAVITATRAEYGLLYWTMKEIQKSDKLELKLIVTGMHLSPEFGDTYKQIEADGFRIHRKVDMLVSSDTSAAVSKSMGLGIIGFAQAYDELKPDIIVVLGDRYEILAAVSAAIPFKIPVAHISGGEVTEGAIDEQIRHAVTKISHIHFPGAEVYAENIKKLGEEDWRVFCAGDPGIENIKRMQFIEKEELFKLLNLDKKKKTFLVTLHPTTLNSEAQEEKECKIFFNVLREYTDVNIVITYPNADGNGKIVVGEIVKMEQYENVRVYKNLGSLKYLSLMKQSDLILGNSSSGLVEAPFLKIPVIDYGDRQKGRLKAQNIIHADADETGLKNAIEKALHDEAFLKQVKETRSIYGEGNTSEQIVKVLEGIPLGDKLLKKKLVFGEQGKI